MAKLLTPKNDVVFKMLFTADMEILADLINCALKLPEERKIVSVTVKNPTILPDEIGSKYIVLDIRAENETGGEYDIEMQVRRFDHFPQRTLYYLCRMYSEQLKAGKNYSELHPVIGIYFLDYEQFPGHDDFYYSFFLKDVHYPELNFTDDISFHIFEMPGAKKYMEKYRINRDNLLEWLDFFNNIHEEKEDAMQNQYSNPMINRAVDRLKILSADITTRELAERREKALKDEAMFLEGATRKGREEGRKEGRNEGKKEKSRATAIKLLQMKVLTIDQIAEAVEMDVKEVMEIERQLSAAGEL